MDDLPDEWSEERPELETDSLGVVIRVTSLSRAFLRQATDAIPLRLDAADESRRGLTDGAYSDLTRLLRQIHLTGMGEAREILDRQTTARMSQPLLPAKEGQQRDAGDQHHNQ